MKRWYVDVDNKIMKIYATNEKDIFQLFKNSNINSIKPCYDCKHLYDINKIKDESTFIGFDYKNREVYQKKLTDGILLVKLSKDDEYLDFALYQFIKNTSKTVPLTWTISTPHKVVTSFYDKDLNFVRHSYRKYGESKLVKPKELKGVKESFSSKFNNNCKCPCYIYNGNLWIKHRDYFSPIFNPPIEDIGKPTEYILKKYFNKSRNLKRFNYSDTWSSIILRSEAWLCFKNIDSILLHNDSNNIAYTMYHLMLNNDCITKKYHSEYSELEWTTFFENIVRKLKGGEKYENI